MKVRLKTCMAGPKGTFYPGDIIEDNGELVKGGYAEPIEPPVKDGEKIEIQSETDNTTVSGTIKPDGSKEATKHKRSR